MPDDPIEPQRGPVTQPVAMNDHKAEPGLGEATRLFFGALWRETSRLMKGMMKILRRAGAKAASVGGDIAGQFDNGRRALVIRYARYKSNPGVDLPEAPIASTVPDPASPKNANTPRFGLSFRNIAIGVGGLASLALMTMIITVLTSLPDLDDLKSGAENRLIFEDSQGNPLIAQGSVPLDYAEYERIPDDLQDAVLAIEDRRFFDHGGLDLKAIARAGWANMRAGGVVEGGSTITQQLVKITYLNPDRTFRRKLREAILTRQLERRLTKEEILTRYLNAVYLGSGATGMPAAAQVYFGVNISELSLAQSAALAAMIQAPSKVNPFSNLQQLRTRAGLVIDLMQTQDRIDKASANAARAELATMRPQRSSASYGSWFTDWVVREADDLATEFDGVVALRTSLNPEIQKAAESSVREILEQAQNPAEAALIAMTPSGQVVAMVGGRDYTQSQFNRATDALRSPGSTFKTFVYLTALSQGLSPNDRVVDAPMDIDGYRPNNFGDRYRGKVTLAEAFALSLNTATVRLAMAVGLDNVIETARTLGIDAELSETPALALGASGVTLLDMVEAYAGIAAGTIPVTGRGITGISSGDDKASFNFRWPEVPVTDESKRLMAARSDMIEMLALVVSDGTGQAAALPGGAVGKTGTSQDFRDALFIGWNNDLITGVWVGNDDNSPMDGVTGGQLPAQIWKRFMAAATTPNASGSATNVMQSAPAPPSCNVSACQRAYRSFRASDCTFQPYRGGRKLCTR